MHGHINVLQYTPSCAVHQCWLMYPLICSPEKETAMRSWLLALLVGNVCCCNSVRHMRRMSSRGQPQTLA